MASRLVRYHLKDLLIHFATIERMVVNPREDVKWLPSLCDKHLRLLVDIVSRNAVLRFREKLSLIPHDTHQEK